MGFNDRIKHKNLALIREFNYDALMLNKRFLILSACFGMILMASTAMAGSMHSHAHHAGVTNGGTPLHLHVHKAVSPFEAKLGDKRLHCELLGHNPLLPCPHNKIPAGEKETCFLKNECHGGPFQAPASESVGSSPRFLASVVSAENDLPITAGSISPTVIYDPFYSHSLDRPPRAL
jgi:hypothetical protein